MSDPHPPISLLLERVNRLGRELQDFREGQLQLFRILTRALEGNNRALDANTRELTEPREEVRELGAEQASLAMKVDEAMMRAAQANRRLDDRDDGQPPAGSA